ncbi:MAG: hypothetical protein K2O96_07210 [Lachnospiraceae bacterium]|uniref:hypothetical protein n=1 Tax=Mediterraneibacter agrestimuris TaxID=2941333 RepID=UPI00203D26B9|nr:hypothetical protein [Mediterraneibacter agrestimuris]MDE6957871.1 hypothetical protein [Lachnospiraceae bacterium]
MSELLRLHESERYGACEDEVGGIEISTDLSPIERRWVLRVQSRNGRWGHKTLQYA